MDHIHTNLPAPLYPIVGREPELQRVAALLADPAARLIILTGPAGIGKTRLALESGHQARPHFPDGVWMVPLAPTRDPSLVPATIAQACGVAETADRPLFDKLVAALSTGPQLLILDTFEHLEAATPLVADLLAAAPTLRLLVTSRAALHLPAATLLPVPPLGYPGAEAAPGLPPARGEPAGGGAAALHTYPALALFVARAREAQSAFHLDAENAPAVAGICAHLEGVPLALELAAARIRQATPGALLAQLRAHTGAGTLPALSGGAPHLPVRQQTLRGAIGWSYSLLTPADQRLFTHLAVFAGGATRAAIAAVVPADGGDPAGDLDAGLGSLVAQSLLIAAGERYRMLESIRQYALERLEESAAGAALHRRHAAYFVRWVEHFPLVGGNRLPAAAAAQIAPEHENLRAALAWSLADPAAPDSASEAGPELALRLAGALVPFWTRRGYLTEGRRWVEQALAAWPAAPAGLRGRVLTSLAELCWRQGDVAASSRAQELARPAAQAAGDQATAARLHNLQGNIALDQGDYAIAQAAYEESMALRRQVGEPGAIATTLNNLSILSTVQGNFAQSEAYLQESIALAEQAGDDYGVWFAMLNLAEVSGHLGDFARAEVLLEEILARAQQAGDTPNVALAYGNLGQVAQTQGAAARAIECFTASLALAHEVGNQIGIANALTGLGYALCRQGDLPQAARVLATALAHCRDLGLRQQLATGLEAVGELAGGLGQSLTAARFAGAVAPLRQAAGAWQWAAEHRAYEQALAALRAQVPAAAWAAAEAAGAALGWEAALPEALALCQAAGDPPAR